MFTPEDENPDRDAREQDDARDKSPSALYGAEDVLNAQDSSSTLRTAGRSGRSPTQFARLKQFRPHSPRPNLASLPD